MALPYFFEASINVSQPNFILSEETSKHCIQVLRMKVGEQLCLTDGNGHLITASITREDKKQCSVKIVETKYYRPPLKKISIGISILKNTGRFEWFLEKATEIGVNEIIPLLCKRTERQHFRFDRMNNILIAAMLQSRQTWLPSLHEPVPLDHIIQSSKHQQKLIAHCEEEKKSSIKELKLSKEILVLIGPEGDFTPGEIQSALQNNFQPVNLGNTRLRTETAGMVASTLLIIGQ